MRQKAARELWELREAFPLHFIVFKQTASHLAHEANVEQIFSRAGLVADPNLNPVNLVTLVKIGFNKAVCNPSYAAIMDKYFELFRGDAKGKDIAGSSSDPLVDGKLDGGSD